MAVKKAPAKKKATATPRKKVTPTQPPQGGVDSPPAAPVAVPNSPPAESKREFTPITVVGVVDELPITEDAAVSESVVQAIIDANGKWVEVSTGGRKANTTRNNVVKALAKKEMTAKSRVIGEKVFVAVNPVE